MTGGAASEDGSGEALQPVRPPQPAHRSPSVAETHLSMLLFTGDTVFKFKKALSMPFVDFRTVEARHAACVEEVDANRRLSPDVYLGVAALRPEDFFTAPPPGTAALDYAVVMRRMPAGRRLSALVQQHAAELGAPLRRLARLLADFHAGAARGGAIDDAARPPAIAGTWRRCLDTLAQFSGRMVDAGVVADVDRLAMAYIGGRAPLFETRISGRCVCDGHGDLLADDIYLLDDGPRVLDCIEFDPRLRYVDVIADVAFLAMDLERLGAPDLAQAFLVAYQEAAGDHFPSTLVDFYWAARAVVRAEVACLRADQEHDLRAARSQAGAVGLLGMAQWHLQRARVLLVAVSGLPGTGKSTLAAALGERMGWPVLRSDEIRRELVDPGHRGPLLAAEVPGAYGAEVSARTYAALLERAGTALGLGQPVLVDATFAGPDSRGAVEELAARTASDLVVLECRCPAQLAATRMRARLAAGTDVSGADESVARAMAATAAGHWAGVLAVDTSGTLQQSVEHVLASGLLPPVAGPTAAAAGRSAGR